MSASAPFTMGSHSFNARAFVVFISVSSSRLDNAFIDISPARERVDWFAELR